MYIAESLCVRCCCSCCQFHLLCLSPADRLSIFPTILSFLILPLAGLICRRGLVIRLVTFNRILLYHLDDVDDSSETVSLHSLVNHHAPRYCSQSLHGFLTLKTPYVEQVDHISGGPQTKCVLSLAAYYYASPSCSSDKIGCIGDEACASPRIGSQGLGIAYLEAHSPRYGGHTRLGAKVKGEMLRHVQRDYRNVESEAGILKGLFGEWPDGEEVVDAD